VPLHAFGSAQRRPDLPALHGQVIQAPTLRVLLPTRPHHRKPQLEKHHEHLQKIFTILQENFLPGNARTLQPLTNALRGDPKTLIWPPVADFKAAKAALAAVVPLAHPALNAVLSLAKDASDTHVGGVLQQLAGGSWQPLAFYSKKLSGAGTRYSTFDREHHTALVGLSTATDILYRRVYIEHQTHTRPRERGGRRLEPTATGPPTAQPTAEDWLEEGLVAPEGPILAAIAEAQAVDFSAMATAQQSCPEVLEMMYHTADHNTGGRRCLSARGRFDRGVPPASAHPV
jgi:hypothetical protein